jgi:hypothetical protein
VDPHHRPAKHKFDSIAKTPQGAWYGMDLFDEDVYRACDTRCLGFKEIRYDERSVRCPRVHGRDFPKGMFHLQRAQHRLTELQERIVELYRRGMAAGKANYS